MVFVHSAGDVLDAAQEAALQAYVEGGGGYVGVGESALLEQGGTAFFNTLTGLPAARITGTGASSSQDVEFLDRVHPATRQLPLVQKAMTETWYTWATSPTGTVHTVARVRGNALPDGTSITNDATPTSRFSTAVQANQPQLQPARGLVPGRPAGPLVLHRDRRRERELVRRRRSRSWRSARSSGRPAWSAAAARPASTPTTRRRRSRR